MTGSGQDLHHGQRLIARTGLCRRIVLRAQQDAGGAARTARFREFFPEERGRVLRLATTTTTSPRPTCRTRDLFIEKDSSINEHIEQMRLSAAESVLERRDTVHRWPR